MSLRAAQGMVGGDAGRSAQGAFWPPAWGPAAEGMWAYVEDHRMEMHDLSPLYFLSPMGSQSPCWSSSTGSSPTWD